MKYGLQEGAGGGRAGAPPGRGAGMSEPLLAVEGLTKRFGSFRAVDAAGFTVEAGALDALIGPNGAGKTTLFNTVSGLERPDEGHVRLAGRRIDGLPAHEVFAAGMARTFQIPRPFPEMTVLENVMLVPSGRAANGSGTTGSHPARCAARKCATASGRARSSPSAASRR